MAVLLQRICWNSNSWRGPTGEMYGKEDSYVGRNGFGHEEYNFNTNDSIDGNTYGYSYYSPPKGSALYAQKHDIFFFTIHPATKQRLLVGQYRNAQFLTEDEQKELIPRLKSQDILDRRVEELLALELPVINGREQAEKLLFHDFCLNIRVSPENVDVFNPPQELTATDVEGRNPKRLNRYTKPVFLKHVPEKRQETRQQPPIELKDKELLMDAYIRYTPAQQKVVRRRHNLLSERFRRWLRSLSVEDIGTEQESIDIRCKFVGEEYLFELKTCYRASTRHALREALGQILEYSFYPGRRRPERMAIVLDTPPSTAEIEWFEKLGQISLEVELFWLKGESVFCPQITTVVLGGKALKP